MTLGEITQQAIRFAAEGDYAAAEALLSDALVNVPYEPDVGVLDRYAEACKEWGSEEDEEHALREMVRRGVRVDTLLRLLDLLQQRLNTVRGVERVEVVRDCLRIGTEALGLIPHKDVETRANVQYSRGLRHLDLARAEQVGHLDAATEDIQAYVGWLLAGEDIPMHLQRDNLVALAHVDLGEVLLLRGQGERAAVVLEGAIKSLEDAKVAGWMTSRAYALLEQAWGS